MSGTVDGATVALFAVPDAAAPELQLHIRPGTGASGLLFGWDSRPEPVDAGPPPVVADIFAHALARTATVAFLHSPIPEARDGAWLEAAGEQWLQLSPTLAQRLRGHRRVAVVASRRPERLRELFSGDVSWSQQLQAGLLLRAGPLPALSRAQLEEVVSARDADFSELALPAAVDALVLPAVDGDYLELVAPVRDVIASVRGAVAAECASRGVAFEERTDWR